MYKTFKEMPIWNQAMDIAVDIFKETDHLPRKEDFCLTSQIRRSALIISANIAEAFGRHHKKDKIHFYHISRGSLTETQSHLEYGLRVGYFKESTLAEFNQRLSMLYNEINRVVLSLKANKGD